MHPPVELGSKDATLGLAPHGAFAGPMDVLCHDAARFVNVERCQPLGQPVPSQVSAKAVFQSRLTGSGSLARRKTLLG